MWIGVQSGWMRCYEVCLGELQIVMFTVVWLVMVWLHVKRKSDISYYAASCDVWCDVTVWHELHVV